METVNLQVGAARVRDALNKLNRPNRLAMIKSLFPELPNEVQHKMCDNMDTLKLASGTQFRFPAEIVKV
jgi:hypothetical protein